MNKESLKAFGSNLLDAGREAGSEAIDNVRLTIDDIVQEAKMDERYDQENKVAFALIDSGFSDEIVIKILQKYWDKRESEATRMIARARHKISKRSSQQTVV